MQAEESPRAVTSERSGLKPTTAFLLLLLGAALVAVVFYLSKPDPAPTPTGDKTNTAPNFALTNEQAITRFKELADVRFRAYSTHDLTLLESLYTSGSLVRSIAARELRQLNRDGVSDISRYDTRKLSVLSNESDEIRIEEIVVVTPRFVDANGEDVTSKGVVTREVVTWTLRLEDGAWLIHDALLTESNPVEK